MQAVFVVRHFAAFLCVLASLGLSAGCATTPLLPQDTAVLLTAADLESVGAALPSDYDVFERSHKIRHIDGGVELEYEFDAHEAGVGYPYIYTAINREATVSPAVAAYAAVKAGIGMAGLETRDDSERFRYGDWSYFGTLVSKGRALGIVFYMRDNLTVYTVMISGIPIEIDGLWEQLLLPRLEMLSRSAS